MDEDGLYPAVVKLNIPPIDGGRGSLCSGTLVTPWHVMTAHHCFHRAQEGEACVLNDPTGSGGPTACTIPSPVPPFFPDDSRLDVSRTATVSVYARGDDDNPVLVTEKDPDFPLVTVSRCHLNLCSPRGSAIDVVIMRLKDRVPVALAAPIHPPVLGVPTLSFVPNCPGGSWRGTMVGWGQIGVPGGTVNPPWRDRTFASSDDWQYDRGAYRNSWGYFGNYTGSRPGDSGGALIPTSGPQRLCGVTSREYYIAPVGWGSDTAATTSSEVQELIRDNLLDRSETHFVGKCNPGEAPRHPAAVGPGYLDSDADGDGMPDACDPCPFQPDPDPRGNFDPGLDSDGDGVPDRCDNCPYTRNPWPSNVFADQADWDGDGVGDRCDLCHNHPNRLDRYDDDDDHDGVGNLCDNCSRKNPVKACVTDNDCEIVQIDGSTLRGACIERGSFGRCDNEQGWACRRGSDDEGALCGENFLGDAISCLAQASAGRCSLQLDDFNQNGIGAACEGCDHAPSTAINANSNFLAELREYAPILGDTCDPVPLYVSRPVLTKAFPIVPPGQYDYRSHQLFISSAQIGTESDASSTTDVGPIPLGFRQCSCLDPQTAEAVSPVEFERCWGNLCPTNAEHYDDADARPGPELPKWRKITTSRMPWPNNGGRFVNPTFLPAPGGSGTLGEVEREVSSAIQSIVRDVSSTTGPWSAVLPGAPSFQATEREETRMGLLEFNYWHHLEDTAADRVDFRMRDGTAITVGIFWSHFRVGAEGYASPRDQHHLGKLRDHYAYVSTPQAYNFDVDLPHLPPLTPCQNGSCDPVWRGDLLRDPVTPVLDPGPLDVSHSVGFLRVSSLGQLAVQTPQANFSLAGAASSALLSALQNAANVFVAPLEAPGRLTAVGSVPMGVIMPRTLAGPFPSAGVTLTRAGGALILSSELRRLLGTPLPPEAEAESVPAGLSSAYYLYSARQNQVFTVGGKYGTKAARQVWAGSPDWDEWRLLLGGGPTAPHKVLSAAYDDVGQHLYWVDEYERQALFRKLRFARIVHLDLKTGAAKVLLELPRLGLSSRVDLAAQPDGTVILVAQWNNTSNWTAWRWKRAPHGISWLGVAAGSGRLHAPPIDSRDGLMLPVRASASSLKLEGLPPSRFTRGGGCGAL